MQKQEVSVLSNVDGNPFSWLVGGGLCMEEHLLLGL